MKKNTYTVFQDVGLLSSPPVSKRLLNVGGMGICSDLSNLRATLLCWTLFSNKDLASAWKLQTF